MLQTATQQVRKGSWAFKIQNCPQPHNAMGLCPKEQESTSGFNRVEMVTKVLGGHFLVATRHALGQPVSLKVPSHCLLYKGFASF